MELEKTLKAQHLEFSREGNRIWLVHYPLWCSLDAILILEFGLLSCFAHVINIAVQHILKLLKEDPNSDILGHLWGLVHFVRASGECWATFKDVIREGNKTHTFAQVVPEWELLCDVDM